MGAILRLVSNSELQARDDALKAVDAQQAEPLYIGLAAHVERFWQAAQIAKRPIEQKMLQALRQRQGIYEPGELALIRQQGGSEIFMMLTSAKCRGAESWLREILLPDSGRPWGLEPSPMPDLPPAVGQAIVMAIAEQALAAGWEVDDARIDERLMKLKFLAFQKMKALAAQVAQRHENKIADQFNDGGWETAMSGFIYDLVMFPAAFIKGPVQRMCRTLEWVTGPNGQWMPSVSNEIQLQWNRRSPFDIYPAPSMRTLQSGNLIDRYRYTRDDLQGLIGVPGYSIQAINAVLERYGSRGFNSRLSTDVERATLELRQHEQYDPEGNIETLNFWGSCSGKMLLEWSNGAQVDVGDISPYKEYQVEVWKVGGYIIKAALNEDLLLQKPYATASFDEIPDSIWGQGLPEIGRDCQGMCNGAARAIANNAAIASGPFSEVHVDRLADGEKVTNIYPWRVYQTVSDQRGGAHNPAVHFFQANMNVTELLQIYNHFERNFDNVSGFPSYTYGDSRQGGAGRTSSGLAQLVGMVGKGVRRVVCAVDRGVHTPVVKRTYNYNMLHDQDATIKGDLRPVAKGAAAQIIKEQASLRRREMLQATLNPVDAQIMGPKGRAVLLRETMAAEDLPVERIMPDELELELNIANMPPMHELLGKAGPNAGSGPSGGGSMGAPAGMTPGGGTPAGPETMDAAGNKPQGIEQRQQNSGYADGGAIRRVRMVRTVGENGEASLDVETL